MPIDFSPPTPPNDFLPMGGVRRRSFSDSMSMDDDVIDEYSHLCSLRHCVGGAKAMAKGFNKEYNGTRGIELVSRQDVADKDEIMNQFLPDSKLGAAISNSNQLRVVVIFLACHALQLGGEVFLVPASAKLNTKVRDKCVALSEVAKLVMDQVNERTTKVLCVFIVDACRDPGLPDQSTVLDAKQTEHLFSSKQLSGCNHLFMFSTWHGDKAKDGNLLQAHSPYTQALLDSMFTASSFLDVQSAVEAALKTTDQCPTCHGHPMSEALRTAILCKPQQPNMFPAAITERQFTERCVQLKKNAASMIWDVPEEVRSPRQKLTMKAMLSHMMGLVKRRHGLHITCEQAEMVYDRLSHSGSSIPSSGSVAFKELVQDLMEGMQIMDQPTVPCTRSNKRQREFNANQTNERLTAEIVHSFFCHICGRHDRDENNPPLP